VIAPSSLVAGENLLTVTDTDGASPLRLSRACIVLVGAAPPAAAVPERFCAAFSGAPLSGLNLDYTSGDQHNAPFLDQMQTLIFDIDVPISSSATLSADFWVYVPGGTGDLTLTLANTTTAQNATLIFPGAGSNDQRRASSTTGLNAAFLAMGANSLSANADASGRIWAGCLLLDPGTPLDAGPALDAALSPDAAQAIDSGPQAMDAGPAIDAGSPPDAGPSIDAGIPADAGAPGDSGPALDAGASLDGALAPTPDGGSVNASSPDAGEEDINGAPEQNQTNGNVSVKGGCGAVSPQSPLLSVFLAGLLGISRRRQRR
jgi:uncharacterized protein (TIGR03382 family)